ncbi:hypothetical protein BCR42DRAFT_487536 [Absidia repens]|uniref:Myb-like domain-containing protein n=1 Tax=Absidia repens TaxID=90262 RepID=A0A1X2IX18_9FUNG|nr:hypothetical protein BCR42DRAFT_487536 [Absidia repens]
MTGVMDLKHILCEPMEDKPTNPTAILHPLDYYDDNHQKYQRSYQYHDTEHLNQHTRFNSINATHTKANSRCHVSPRQRVHSEQCRTSPVLSWGYHYSHHLHPYYQRDEVLIAPLTSSLSTNMIPSHSSSSSTYSSTPSMTSTLSPSTSSSASSLSSSSSSTLSSPITPTMNTTATATKSTTTTTTAMHDRQQQRRRHRSASTSHVHHQHHHHPHQQQQQAQRHIPDPSASTPPMINQIQTRTPWTPLEDSLLQKGYEQGLSWAMISSTYLPHRSRGCCWGRFKTLQNKNLIDVKVQQQLRSAKLAWKTMEVSKSTSSSLSSSSSSWSSLSPTSPRPSLSL